MGIETLTIGDPFFTIRILNDENAFRIGARTIVLNLSDIPCACANRPSGTCSRSS